MPFADVCYFADYRWWEWHSNGIVKEFPAFELNLSAGQVAKRFAEFGGLKVSIEPSFIPDENVMLLHNYGPDGFSDKPNGLMTGSNSGYQTINLAALANPARVLLLAYDMHYPKGRSHSHNGHPVKTAESWYQGRVATFKTMLPALARRGVEVINCTPGSAIKCFPFDDIERLLPNTSCAVV